MMKTIRHGRQCAARTLRVPGTESARIGDPRKGRVFQVAIRTKKEQIAQRTGRDKMRAAISKMGDRELDLERLELVRLTAVSAATDAGRAARLARRSLLVALLALIVAVGIVLFR